MILVFCPSLALMENQIAYLRTVGFDAECINHTTPYDDRDTIISQLSSLDFFYITPEMYASNFNLRSILIDMLDQEEISLVVVDEAHVIEDKIEFRPDFSEIKKLRKKFQNVGWLALTTCSRENSRGIAASLKMIDPTFIYEPSTRRDIFYDVRYFDDSQSESLEESRRKGFKVLEDSIANFFTESQTSGIIYVTRDCLADLISEHLNYCFKS